MLTPQFILALSAKLVIDLFADGVGVHEINHPQTRQYREDIRRVEPLAVTRGEIQSVSRA